ncbi:galactitol-1-phosphate 5-dehydrogenase [Helicobacter turcicus]|uniref:Galactitol-1-phosphate 5-dehydrogenase n=1 Tax=Helicobacter turcicus TaxID=2867412 RepID=A0ABS7JPU2_9HELI|nr:galactitol-1-phosphate 5-dehydrogenase [Helicobacter turcicus]MBX7491429.1 galactitol-1-phosphate 5-dehydrogenase [Helicobacter turcicus]MBX7545889.1 galactitol-1-phosphate 5-dehydrogenase [Helicobacter turcicus]
MKACVLQGIEKIEQTKVARPNVKVGEALVQIKACGICSSDLDRFHKGAYHYPLILGHEISGEIVAVAEDLDKNLIGKRVVVFPLLPCKKCQNCQSRNYAQCENYNYFGSRRDGGFAEFLSVPLWNLKIFEDKFDFLNASLCEPAAVAKHALSKLRADKRICIVGSGVIGILIGIWAKLENLRISFLIRNATKAKFLESLGFEVIFNEKIATQKFDSCIECVGSEESLQSCIEATKSKGKIILVGNPKGAINLPQKVYWKILREELQIIGVWNSDYPKDWDFVLKNLDKIPAKSLITHTFKLQECQEAFKFLSNANFHIKGTFVNG